MWSHRALGREYRLATRTPVRVGLSNWSVSIGEGIPVIADPAAAQEDVVFLGQRRRAPVEQVEAHGFHGACANFRGPLLTTFAWHNGIAIAEVEAAQAHTAELTSTHASIEQQE